MEKPELNEINKLVNMAFGKGFSGDYIMFESRGRQVVIKGNRPDIIARKKFPYIPKLNEKYEIAGRFTSEDGSSMNVDLRYANSAERYADYYYLHFKKNPLINGEEVSIRFKGLKI